MEIRSKRYQEMVRAELTLEMIKDFVLNEHGKMLPEAILNHITWLMNVYEEQKEER